MKTTFTHVQYVFLGILLLLCCTLFFSVVHAQESSISPIEAVDPRLMEVPPTTAVIPRTEEAPAPTVATLPVAAQDRIINLSSNITNRLTAATNRMLNITERLESRIVKIQAEGKDTQPAYEKLLIAEARLHAAEDMLAGGLPISAMVRGDKPRESFEQIRLQFVMIHGLITEAKALIGETISMLRTVPNIEAISPETPMP